MPIVRPRLIVELYEGWAFSGRRAVVVDNAVSRRAMGMRGRIFSARIFEGPGFDTSPNQKAVLYDRDRYRGNRLPLAPGFYPNIQDLAQRFGQPESIRFEAETDAAGPVWGSIPLVVETYDWPNYSGRRQTVVRDIPDTGAMGQENTISSIRIYKGPNYPRRGCRVTFYSEAGFAGQRMPIEMRSTEHFKEFPDLSDLPQSIGNEISSIGFTSWSDRSDFDVEIFRDEFFGRIEPGWRWADPEGGDWEARNGPLTFSAKQGQDLTYDAEHNAPRLYRHTRGDFAVETLLPLEHGGLEHGGLYIRKDENRCVRLEKTCRAHDFHGDVMFQRHDWRFTRLIGRADAQRARQIYLRLERKGDVLVGLASEDGSLWQQCGETVMGMSDPVEFGLTASAPGETPDTRIQFAYFKSDRRKRDVREFQRSIARRDRRRASSSIRRSLGSLR